MKNKKQIHPQHEHHKYEMKKRNSFSSKISKKNRFSNKMLKEENPVHVKLEYNEAIEFKKNSLNLETYLLKMAKKIDSYGILRDKELELKIILCKKFKELRSFVSTTEKAFPEVEVSRLEEEEVKGHEKDVERKIKQELNIEDQLKEIQKKLEKLQSENV